MHSSSVELICLLNMFLKALETDIGDVSLLRDFFPTVGIKII